MPFDVYRQTQACVRGLRVFARDQQDTYVNQSTVQDGKMVSMEPGHYEFLSEEENHSIKLYDAVSGTGVHSENVIAALIHHQEGQLDNSFSEARALAIRSLKMALDALSNA